MTGALFVVYEGQPLVDAQRVLERRLPEGATVWNDEPGRTKAEVVAVLKELDL